MNQVITYLPSKIQLFSLLEKFKYGFDSTFPGTIKNGEFQFVKSLNDKGYRYSIAIYKDKKGNEYIAKMWSGLVKNKSYYFLKNELYAYERLWKITNSNGKQIKTAFPNINIPKLIYNFENTGRLILLIEKIDGEELQSKSISQKVKQLESCRQYLIFLSGLIKQDESYDLKTIKPSTFVLRSSLLSLVALIKNPNLYQEIIFSLTTILKNSKSILYSNDTGIVHRDLTDDNVLTSGNRLTIIDFELSAFSLISHDFANMYFRLWNKSNKDYLENLLTKNLTTKNKAQEYKSMLLYSALFDLSFGVAKNSQENKNFINHIRKKI